MANFGQHEFAAYFEALELLHERAEMRLSFHVRTDGSHAEIRVDADECQGTCIDNTGSCRQLVYSVSVVYHHSPSKYISKNLSLKVITSLIVTPDRVSESRTKTTFIFICQLTRLPPHLPSISICGRKQLRVHCCDMCQAFIISLIRFMLRRQIYSLTLQNST